VLSAALVHSAASSITTSTVTSTSQNEYQYH
jgi:hypothetical protein